MDIKINIVDPSDKDLHALIGRLDEELLERYKHGPIFGVDFTDPKVNAMTFVVAYCEGTAVGCGAIRPYDDDSAELKRFFVDRVARGKGVASRMLSFLEGLAKEQGFSVLKLETGMRQPEAISLYRKFGYYDIPLFGEYLTSNAKLSLCMEKRL